MAVQVAVAEVPPGRSQCWCCGMIDDPMRMVHLGNHPEVALCIRCGHWASKQAWAIEDRSKNGLAPRVRDKIRLARHTVIRRGWHRNPIVGRGLKWLGKFVP